MMTSTMVRPKLPPRVFRFRVRIGLSPHAYFLHARTGTDSTTHIRAEAPGADSPTSSGPDLTFKPSCYGTSSPDAAASRTTTGSGDVSRRPRCHK